MPARLFLSSGDLIADRRYEFARDLQLKGDLLGAADVLEQAIEIAPRFASPGLRSAKFARNLASAMPRSRPSEGRAMPMPAIPMVPACG
jgi:hypothetical protein